MLKTSAGLVQSKQEVQQVKKELQENIHQEVRKTLQEFVQLKKDLRESLVGTLKDVKSQHEGEIVALRRREQDAEVRLASLTSQSQALHTSAQSLLQTLKRTMQRKSAWTTQPIVDPFQERLNGTTRCFYTAIFANPGQEADSLAPIEVPIPGWDAVCFTNLDLPPTQGWLIIKYPLTEDPRLAAKRIKWQSHKVLEDYDIVVWVDAYITPNKSHMPLLHQWILQMMQEKATIGHRKHKERDCVYDECDAVIQFKRDTPDHVNALRAELAAANMPKQYGLYDTNIMIRFHKDLSLQLISNTIMQALQTITFRDQLILPLLYYTEQFNSIYTADFLKVFVKSGTHIRRPAY
jgi:hypothetical protein